MNQTSQRDMHEVYKYKLIAMLEGYNPSVAEIVFQKQMLAFIAEHEDCFERSLAIGHITASCWLLNQERNKALMMHHAKHNNWFQLGGHCDGNADVLSVAIKEAQEESGIVQIVPVYTDIFDIDIHLIPATAKEKEHYHYDIRFLLHVNSDEHVVQNRESKELRWISKDIEELPTQNPSVVRMFNKWLTL